MRKAKLAKLYNYTDLVVNFAELFKYKGKRDSKNLMDSLIGRIVLLVGTTFVITYFINIFNQGFNIQNIISPQEVADLSIYVGIGLIIYGLFLIRDKSEFESIIEPRDLRVEISRAKKRQVREIEIENFLTEEALIPIDSSYQYTGSEFVISLMRNLLKIPTVKNVARARLGLTPTDILKFEAQFKKENQESSIINIMTKLFNLAYVTGASQINELHLFVVVLKEYCVEVLRSFEITADELSALEQWLENASIRDYYQKAWRQRANLKRVGAINASMTSRRTPLIDIFGKDLTMEVAREGLFYSLGKVKSLKEVIAILRKKSGAAVMLIGEPGVGKSSLIRHIATLMVLEDVPKELFDKRLVVVELIKIMARSSSMDESAKLVYDILDEVARADNIILVLEDLGKIFARTGEAGQIIQVIDQMASENNTKVIATAISDDYQRHISANKDFSSGFQTIEMGEPDFSETLQILLDELPLLETKFQIEIQIKALRLLVNLAGKIQHEKAFPDKAIELLEEVCILAQHQGLAFVDAGFVSESLSEKVGSKVGILGKDEAQLLSKLEEEMHKRVIGQHEAIRSVASAIRRTRAGLKTGNKPIASFLFYGPTGVGKTEVAKTLADVYYGDEKNMIRLDMSEYQEEENLNRLIGYRNTSGEFIPGIFTEAVKKRPFSLILLDEIEKANTRVLDIFLQILDEGKVKDGSGSEIDFQNTILISTTNAGGNAIAEMLQQGKIYRNIEPSAFEILKQSFRIEFLNRFDKLVMFSALTRPEINLIAEKILMKLKTQLKSKGIDLLWNNETLEELSNQGYNPVFGARELKRVVQVTIEDLISDKLINGDVKPGDTISLAGLVVNKL